MSAASSPEQESKLDSPSAHRNKDPIWKVLENHVFDKSDKTVLEVASGAGIHMDFFCRKLADKRHTVDWHPVDSEERYLKSIEVYASELKQDLGPGVVVHDPLSLTLNEKGIQQEQTRLALPKKVDVILCFNMIHIAPWSAAMGLMKLAGERLTDGSLVLYGPFFFEDHIVESNVRFDESLKSRDPSWGVRKLQDVLDLAQTHGLELKQPPISMPANNHLLLFWKPSG